MPTDLGGFPHDFDTPGASSGPIPHASVSGRLAGSFAVEDGTPTGGRAPDPVGSHPPGLVEQETTTTFATGSTALALKIMGKERRLRRMRMGVIAHADATRTALQQGGHRHYAAFVTLTYAAVDGWEPCHISEYLDRLRKWCARRVVKLHYEWVMELQERGAPHYHIVLWLPEGFKVPKPDTQGWWGHGMSNIKRATRGVGYLVKYVSKGNNTMYAMPVGARLFQTGGDKSAALARHRACLPKWLREQIPEGRARREIGGWVSVESGEFFSSPYSMRWGYDEYGCAFVTICKRSTTDKDYVSPIEGSPSVEAVSGGESEPSDFDWGGVSPSDLRELHYLEREREHFYRMYQE